MHNQESTVEIDPQQRYELVADVFENGGGTVKWSPDNPSSLTIGAKADKFDTIMSAVRARIAGNPTPVEPAPVADIVVDDSQAVEVAADPGSEVVEGVAQPVADA